ncbi:MAG: tRNA uridine-5-carboxymethylaminomethyl(34) synthesis GTPase MnmE [Firmicutes bacterium]|nr:tRNA uridine-5-carboxymethylaminomethyl(34) synthesis GTPase MnmE [Bacillota bacterium]
MRTSTIAGISTPIGNAGVGIIRISGPQAVSIVSRCFDEPLVPRVATLGIISTHEFSDTVLVIHFPAPRSFTGEDVVEIQAHGGSFLLQKILDHVLVLGAELATPGEFSKRAFLNGKLSLDMAEAIIETITAESEAHLRSTSAVHGGRLREMLASFERALVAVAAQIEATLDYPEHDIEHATRAAIRPHVESTVAQITDLIGTAHQGRLFANGVQVAVLGRPNVGKSSLFNAILGRDRSIVTNIEGTTTDTISESIPYRGLRLVFNDTAGIRTATGEIEKIGITRTKKTISESDVVLVIFDGPSDDEILAMANGKPTIIALNKCDIISHENRNGIIVSAKTGENIEKLKESIYQMAIGGQTLTAEMAITNTRHLAELSHAHACLASALIALDDELSLDLVAGDITDALAHIGNITGTHTSDAVIDEIFSRFCLGK